jgi:3,4-dihydroxy 2-butanone 4-phosphate synthase/GTP cyclohydrolase II
MEMKFNTIPEILQDIKNGKIVIMMDDYDRENEGDFVMASDMVTPDAINFMALYGRGLICTPVDISIAKKLDLTPMTPKNSATHETAFTVTIDAKENISTGISSFDRAYTIKLMMNEKSVPSDFARPGHVFPLIAKEGGVLVRRGHTEAAVDLARLSGFNPSGVICEVLKEDGHLARGSDLMEIAKRFNLKIGTIADLADYLADQKNSKDVECVANTKFPNKFGLDFRVSIYRNSKTSEELTAITLGNHFELENSTLVRLHSECFTGDIFGSLRCDCGDQLNLAMKKIAENGSGVFLYLKQEGRGIGLSEKIKTYELQEMGFDTIEANLKLGHPIDNRSYILASQVLEKLKIKNIDLMTNNPKKVEELKDFGFQVNRLSLVGEVNSYNQFYIDTKKEKMGHLVQ